MNLVIYSPDNVNAEKLLHFSNVLQNLMPVDELSISSKLTVSQVATLVKKGTGVVSVTKEEQRNTKKGILYLKVDEEFNSMLNKVVKFSGTAPSNKVIDSVKNWY